MSITTRLPLLYICTKKEGVGVYLLMSLNFLTDWPFVKYFGYLFILYFKTNELIGSKVFTLIDTPHQNPSTGHLVVVFA
jgi:hypothetical protein